MSFQSHILGLVIFFFLFFFSFSLVNGMISFLLSDGDYSYFGDLLDLIYCIINQFDCGRTQPQRAPVNVSMTR